MGVTKGLDTDPITPASPRSHRRVPNPRECVDICTTGACLLSEDGGGTERHPVQRPSDEEEGERAGFSVHLRNKCFVLDPEPLSEDWDNDWSPL